MSKKVMKEDYLINWLTLTSSCMFPPQNEGKQYLVEYQVAYILNRFEEFAKVPASLERVSSIAKFLDSKILPFNKKLLRKVETNPDADIKKLIQDFKLEKTKDPKSFLPIAFGMYTFIKNDFEPEQIPQIIENSYAIFEKDIQTLVGISPKIALAISAKILNEIITHMEETAAEPVFDNKVTKQKRYLSGYPALPLEVFSIAVEDAITFDKKRLERILNNQERPYLSNYLKLFSISPLNFKQNKFNEKTPYTMIKNPIIEHSGKYVIPIPPLLLQTLPLTFDKILLTSQKCSGKYIAFKGRIAENKTYENMLRIFPAKNIVRNKHYDKKNGNPDVDLLIANGSELWVIENTSKVVKLRSMLGDENSIKNDLEKSIVKCYKQAFRAIKAYKCGELKLPFKNKFSNFKILIITDNPFPNILHSFSNLDKNFFSFIKRDQFPFITNNLSLDKITSFCKDNNLERKFIDYVNLRIKLRNNLRIYCTFEEDLFDYFVTYDLIGTQKKLASKGVFLCYNGLIFNNKRYEVVK